MDKDTTLSLVQTVCQGIFIIVVTVLSLGWLFKNLKYYCTKVYTELSRNDEVQETLLDQQRYQQQAECRQKMQEVHLSKASYYNERILKPREESKKLKKEKDFYKFLGPAWQTEGAVLGGEDSLSDDDNGNEVSEGRRAAKRRKVPEQINRRVANAAAVVARQKPKRIIKLPEEPLIDQEGVISVMLRTPIGTICQRRFYACDTIQCLLDYVTTQGFSQSRYTVATSYPRMLLENPDSLLSDYNFGKRIALNIVEKD